MIKARTILSKSKFFGVSSLAFNNKISAAILSFLIVGVTAVIFTGQAPAASAKPVAPNLQWSPCASTPGLPDANQQCATLSVPLDYRSPNGQKINVAVSRITAANPSARRGVLLLNPGGPGGSGLDLPRIFTELFPKSILNEYDLVGFDPRGIASSTPISCGLTEDQANQAYVPITQNGSFTDTVNFVQSVANSCAAHSGTRSPFITTANTARDMDQIRTALGEQKISYLGYSYGTYLGAVYASLFPNNMDRFVLDSSVDPTAVWRNVFRLWGKAGPDRFPDFANFAVAHDNTYHLGTTPKAVNNLYFQTINRLKTTPFVVPVGTNNVLATDGMTINDTIFRELAFTGLYDDGFFPDLASLWHLINTGASGTPIPDNTLGGPLDNATAAGLSILCGDTAWSRDPSQYQQELNSDIQQFPMFGELGSNIWECAFWASQPIEPTVAITPSGPKNNILIVQDTRDPATPYSGGVNMRAALGDRSRLVSVDQGGHAASYVKPNACASDITTAWLADGIFPKTDPSCAAQGSSTNSATPVQFTPEQQSAIKNVLRRMKF